MFRGGHVSSYGTGIASGLADGGRVNYAGGGQIGGGIIYGEPMADGRYGFGIPKTKKHKYNKDLFDVENVIGETQTGAALGHLKAPDFAPIPTDEDEGELTNAESLANQKAFEKKMSVNTWDEFISYDVKNRITGETTTHKRKNPNYDPPHKFIDAPTEGPGSGKITGKRKVYLTNEELAAPTTGTTLPGEEYIPDEDTDIVAAIESGDGEEKIELEEKPELSSKEMVEANKELFGELLGLDKARGQDISDMLIGASAKFLKPGATVKGGLGEFMEAESQRPSRRQKLQDTAAGLAIQDYIAGKRAAEQIDKLKEVETWRSDLKTSAYKIDPEKDSWRDALDKTVLKYGGKEGKSNSVEIIAETIKSFEPGKTIRRKDGVKPKKRKKALKDLKEGITIISYNDGTKEIIEKIGENYNNLTSQYPI
jgi:hypothetical protein